MGSAQLSVPHMAPNVSVWKKAKFTKGMISEGRVHERSSLMNELWSIHREKQQQLTPL